MRERKGERERERERETERVRENNTATKKREEECRRESQDDNSQCEFSPFLLSCLHGILRHLNQTLLSLSMAVL